MNNTVYRLNGRKVTRAEFMRDVKPFSGVPMTLRPGTWPLISDAMGVHPNQIKKAMEDDRALGVSAEYTADGSVIFTGPAHRKRYCEAHGIYDRNGSYGDPQRR